MLDIKFIRENAELIQMGAMKKHLNFEVNELIAVDDKRKAVSQKLEEKRAIQNKVSEEVAKLGQAGKIAEKRKLIEEMQPLKEEMQKIEEELREIMIEWQKLMVAVPNIPDMSVPDGNDDADNQEAKVWGEIPKFDFTPKDHIELMESLDLADFEAGSKVAGFRGYFLKNEGAELAFAIWQLTMDLFRKNHKDYGVMFVPSLVKRETLLGSGYLPQGEDDLYHTQDSDYLAGTAEVATMSYFTDKVLDKKDLPKKVLAFSPAFRREAGSYSKDTKGLYRVHEFMKLSVKLVTKKVSNITKNFWPTLSKYCKRSNYLTT
jgi:seryl-tRNA synthetase